MKNATRHGHPIVAESEVYMVRFSEKNLPLEWDWRDYGAITSAVQQGTCGSCWAFTTAAMVEAQNKIAGGSLFRLAPQQLVDCASNDATGNMGCDGGHPVWTYPWLSTNKLLEWSEYPYDERENGYCRKTWRSGMVGIAIRYGYGLYQHEPRQLKSALRYGPVAVSIDADSVLFRDYKGGVIKSPACGTNVGHAVLAVGYGTDRYNDDYVTIKNSWGPTWGENGFVKISLSQLYAPEGICAVLSDLSIATN